MLLLWIWIAVAVIALVILAVAGLRLLRRLGGLGRAVARLRHRQEEAVRLQEKLLVLQQTVAQVEARVPHRQ